MCSVMSSRIAPIIDAAPYNSSRDFVSATSRNASFKEVNNAPDRESIKPASTTDDNTTNDNRRMF